MEWVSEMSENRNEVFAAVAKAMGEVKRLAKDNKNTEQKYDFASIDDFMAMVGPICAQNGLVTVMSECSKEFVEKQGKYGVTHWVAIEYEITTFHASGGALPTVKRNVEVVRSGPQAYGAAQSFVLKQYYRGLFAIPTGDKDDPDGKDAGAEIPTTKMSADQFKEIQDLIEKTGTDEDKLCAYWKVAALHDLNATQCRDAIAMLKKKAAA
jgi:hypothetical protein